MTIPNERRVFMNVHFSEWKALLFSAFFTTVIGISIYRGLLWLYGNRDPSTVCIGSADTAVLMVVFWVAVTMITDNFSRFNPFQDKDKVRQLFGIFVMISSTGFLWAAGLMALFFVPPEQQTPKILYIVSGLLIGIAMCVEIDDTITKTYWKLSKRSVYYFAVSEILIIIGWVFTFS